MDYNTFLRVKSIDEIVYNSSPRLSGAHNDRQPRKGRRRGKRCGALVRSRKRNSKAPLPSIFLANVRSLRNKFDELCCHIATRKDYGNCCAYFLTETWLDDNVPDSAMTPPGFSLFRMDRDLSIVDKRKGGGVGFMINDKWCTDC